MSTPAPIANSESANRLSHPRALRDIAIVGGPILFFGVVGNLVGLSTMLGGALVNIGYLVMIGLGHYVLRKQSNSWNRLGLALPNSITKTVYFGVLAFVAALVVFVLAQAIAVAIVTAAGLLPPEIDQSRFNPVKGNVPVLLLLITLSWTTIAFGEELFFRAFLISRLTDIAGLRASRATLIAGLVFGMIHFAEGPIGVVSNGAFGVLFGWIYCRSGRNLWITIIAHGLINTMRFSLLYVGAF